MRPTRTIVSAAVLVLLLAACGDDTPSGSGTTPDPTSSPTATATPAEGDAQIGAQVAVAFTAQNDSGITGTAMLVQTSPGTVAVSVVLTGAGDGPQPIHIHPGSCEQLDPTPKYPLQDVTGGRSTTEVQVGLETLLDGEFAINVHKSASEAQIYVACGNIARS